jgi:hypothetical protein
VAGDVDSDFLHDGNRLRPYVRSPCSGALNVKLIAAIVTKKALRHLASGRVCGAKNENSFFICHESPREEQQHLSHLKGARAQASGREMSRRTRRELSDDKPRSISRTDTENLKVSVSAPAVFTAEPLMPSRMAAFTPMTGDIEGLLTWRFHRQDTGVGSRVESALISGVLLPGPQDMGGTLGNIESSVGGVIAGVTGFASRSNYFWVGGSYQRYAERSGDTRPDLLAYSVAYAYRPRSWRTDTGGIGEFSASLRANAPGESNAAVQPFPVLTVTSLFSARQLSACTKTTPFQPGFSFRSIGR